MRDAVRVAENGPLARQRVQKRRIGVAHDLGERVILLDDHDGVRRPRHRRSIFSSATPPGT